MSLRRKGIQSCSEFFRSGSSAQRRSATAFWLTRSERSERSEGRERSERSARSESERNERRMGEENKRRHERGKRGSDNYVKALQCVLLLQ